MAGKKTLNLQWNGYEATFDGDEQITLVNRMLQHIHRVEAELVSYLTLIKVIEEHQNKEVK